MASVQDRFNGTLRELGWPEHAIQGVGMNATDESGWNPTIGGDNGQAYGLLQWNGPRKAALFRYAAENGMNPGDPELQARFLHHEGQTNERKSVAATWAARSPGEAGAIFVNQFERPAEEHRARRSAKYSGGGGDMATMSSRGGGGGGGGGTFGFMEGEPDEYGAFAAGDLPPPTMRDRIAAGLVGAGDVLGALGAGHATNFAATDAFLSGQQERRALKAGREMTTENTNQTIGWLERQGYTDLADLVRSGGDAKDATNEALARRKAEMEAAATGGGSPLPQGVDKELYQTGTNLGLLNRNLQSLEGILLQMDEAMAAGDTDRFRALKEAAQSIENDFKSGMGNYQSFGNEPNDAILEQGGIGIPQDLVSEKELNEIIEKHGSDFPAMAVALVQKYPDLAPILGSMAGASALGGDGAIGTGAAVVGGLGGGGAGLWLKSFLEGEGSDTAAAKFNRLRIGQAKLRLGITGRRIQNEMRTAQEQYRAGTGQDFSIPYGEGWDTYVWGAKDPSDPDGWN